MISVCIPIYNWNVTELVSSLLASAKQADTVIEIILSDDASTQYVEENKSLESLEGVYYFDHPKNLGRASNRNYLAYKAQFDYLLFVDGDASLPDNLFLSRYKEALAQSSVICGGTKYHDEAPESDKLLRWTYGKAREEIPATIRNLKPNNSFSTFNFLIEKSLFNRLKFDENILGYGHEDTLFGIQMAQKGQTVWHIENPLFHEGLESNSIFIQKTKEGLRNLVEITKSHPEMEAYVQVLKWYYRLKRTGGITLLSRFAPLSIQAIVNKLNGPAPSLKLFDLFKLLYLAQIKA